MATRDYDNDNAAELGAALPSRIKYTEAEKPGVRAQKIRLGRRNSVGKDWNGVADNDNLAWPLATALIREGNTELLKAAMAYRRVYDTAKSEALLGGKSASLRDGFALDRHTHIRPSGQIAYKHVRQSEAASVDIPASMKVAPYANEDDGIERNVVRVPKAWNGDKPVNDMIDAQAKLTGLRHRLGVLVEPLEMSVIDGATYEAIGYSLREAHKVTATAVGRATVHMALLAIRDALGNVSRKDLAA